MAIKSSNSNLHKAREAKKDEFYTQLSDIEKELRHYKEHFKGKVVFAIVTTRASAISSIIFPTSSWSCG
jgi:hypothetical protein